MTTVRQRKAEMKRARRWRAANPERARQIQANYRARHPLTAEQLARKAEVNRAWRAKNAAKLKREQRAKWVQKAAAANARRRAKYALDAAKERARVKAWKVAHPEHSRDFYHRNRDKFVGDGRWSSRSRRFNRAWRKFTRTGTHRRAA